MSRRAAIIVLDGLGIGAAHDTDAYGDTGSDTLGNTLRAGGDVHLPELEALGLGCCAPLHGLAAVAAPTAAWGTCQPAGAGKDSTTGHWELCGLTLAEAFPTYPSGFPAEVVEEFARRTGRAGHRQQGVVRHGDSRRTGRRAPAYRRVDRLHLGGQRLPGGRA